MVQATGPGAPAHGHVVLAAADSDAFASLRRRPTAGADRYRMGKDCGSRFRARRWATGPRRRPARPGRADQGVAPGPAGLADPVRVGRMAASPYGFLRGTAIVMAEDVAHLPSTGITPVICGDAHLGNFGFYASPGARPGHRPERLRRGASRRLGVGPAAAGGQHLGGRPAERRQRAECANRRSWRCVAGYRERGPGPGRPAAAVPVLPAARRRPPAARPRSDKSLRAEIERAAARARRRTSDRALPKFTSERDGQRRIVEDPPLITRLSYAEADQVARGPGRVPGHPGPALAAGAGRLHAGRHRAQGGRASAASGCGPTSRCWKAAARTTWCSCS